ALLRIKTGGGFPAVDLHSRQFGNSRSLICSPSRAWTGRLGTPGRPASFTAEACRKSGKHEGARRQSPSLSRIQTSVRGATTRDGADPPDDLDRKQSSDQSPLCPPLLHK